MINYRYCNIYMCISISLSLSLSLSLYIYIYIYIYRERERDIIFVRFPKGMTLGRGGIEYTAPLGGQTR